MITYRLNLESGPRQRTTMAHMPDWPGCVAQGTTSAEAVEQAPAAIRRFIRFLARQGEALDPDQAFDLTVSEHVMQGPWLGYGDPAPGFKTDFEPLNPGELELSLQRMEALQAGFLELITRTTLEERQLEPPNGHRSLEAILVHMAASEAVYVRYFAGKFPEASAALKAVEANPTDIGVTLPYLWSLHLRRLAALTPAELAQQVPHGQVTWTARRTLRRVLEHRWEHALEFNDRLGADIF
jgi:predicted RNase H-like HicB family nuclease